jgi:hypothetical protein
VKRGDLVISTMGRSFWIMDNVAPLRALAASLPVGSTSSAQSGPVTGTSGRMAVGAAVAVPLGARAQPPMDLSRPVLLQPASRVRYRSAGGGRGGAPQYPTVALAIDYILPAGFTGPLSLQIVDATGKIVRIVQASPGRGAGAGRGRGAGAAATASGDPDDPDMRIGRGRGGAAPMTMRAGHNRYMWDYRWANGGPLAAPGKYSVSLLAGTPASSGAPAASPEATRTFEVQIDPGVLKDGVTAADLAEQQNFLLKLRDVQAEATQLRDRVQAAMQKAGVQPPSSPGAGESPFRRTTGAAPLLPLQALWARLVTAPGTYEQGMLIDQLGNIARAEGGADQKVGSEARRRLDDLTKELKAIEAELVKVGQ